MDEKWGVGCEKDARAYARTFLGDEEIEIVLGEHPHTRSNNNRYARFDDGSIEAFDGFMVIPRFEVQGFNYLKTSGLSGDEVRRGVYCRIFLNALPVYAVHGRDLTRVVLTATLALDKLYEHPVQLWNHEERAEVEGRRVWYQNMPAIITHANWNDGTISLDLDTKCAPRAPGRPPSFSPAPSDEEPEQTIVTDILDEALRWYRA